MSKKKRSFVEELRVLGDRLYAYRGKGSPPEATPLVAEVMMGGYFTSMLADLLEGLGQVTATDSDCSVSSAVWK